MNRGREREKFEPDPDVSTLQRRISLFEFEIPVLKFRIPIEEFPVVADGCEILAFDWENSSGASTVSVQDWGNLGEDWPARRASWRKLRFAPGFSTVSRQFSDRGAKFQTEYFKFSRRNLKISIANS